MAAETLAAITRALRPDGRALLTAFLLSLPFQQRFTAITTNQKIVYLIVVLLSVSATGEDTVAVVRAVVRPLGPLLPAFEVTERAVAATEIGVAPAGRSGP